MTPPLVLRGRVVTMDEDRGVIDDGAVYVGADEHIAAVQERGDPAPAGFETAPRIDTGGCIYPGLIDLHGHMVYNVLPLWSPPDHPDPYTTRYQWPGDGSYDERISDPANALGAMAGKAHLKYVEVKAVVGGTTAIQGSAKMAYPYEGWLVRNVEYETFKTGKKTVYQSALPLMVSKDGKRDDYKVARGHMKDGAAFIYHVAEGTDPELVSEYDTLRKKDCLLPSFCGIHCTALQRGQYDEWHTHGGSVVWSPFSNLWLYRDTTHVADARKAHMRICLGADWSPSGSKSLLGELKVADLWNRDHMDAVFSAEELCAMVTRNPADALGWDDRLGRLREGLHADVLVTADRGGDPYRNLITSIERDVELVAINGQPFYGTLRLMSACGAERAERITVGRWSRRVQLIYPDVKDADMSWAEVIADLVEAIKDPVARYLEIEKLHEVGKPPPWLMTDKPWDDPKITGKPVPITVRIPPLDSLTHDAAYFKAVKASPIHGHLLDGLRAYYQG
jgi:cytosine/adenosine deaminase-related metal-dependent hydrolase